MENEDLNSNQEEKKPGLMYADLLARIRDRLESKNLLSKGTPKELSEEQKDAIVSINFIKRSKKL
jgi:hypothetical protein